MDIERGIAEEEYKNVLSGNSVNTDRSFREAVERGRRNLIRVKEEMYESVGTNAKGGTNHFEGIDMTRLMPEEIMLLNKALEAENMDKKELESFMERVKNYRNNIIRPYKIEMMKKGLKIEEYRDHLINIMGFLSNKINSALEIGTDNKWTAEEEGAMVEKYDEGSLGPKEMLEMMQEYKKAA